MVTVADDVLGRLRELPADDFLCPTCQSPLESSSVVWYEDQEVFHVRCERRSVLTRELVARMHARWWQPHPPAASN